MPANDLIKQLEDNTAEALAMGGAEKLAARKAQGLLNARERIDYLVDPGSFIESGPLRARHTRGGASTRRPPTARSPDSRSIDGPRHRAGVERLHRARRIVAASST